ncbi:flagellar basal body rod protein FlgB [Clostridium sp. JN-9]|uniref:flagellar basal body rod protein FlgB n=1 Tax=Clostridium sp. JN-9 TaxID=2507159 RepID=UPI000FFE13FB|nr:flagellar basal body rod protein FlgB [Clostridium sp. JN-9]QAT39947.1 flagellar basal body rod protein FlgB [Clostridium sp. JN-9]
MGISNVSKNEYTYNILKRGLDAASERGTVIGNNIANINTKDYKRKYVTFEETLKNSSDNLEMKTTDEKHMKINGDAGDIQVKQDNSNLKEDGNNVDIDNEMVNLAANNLMYNAMISQINSRFSMTKDVINGGK